MEPQHFLFFSPEKILLLPVCILHLPRHHGQELGEVDGAVTVGVHLVDHVLQLGLGGVLTQGPHHLGRNKGLEKYSTMVYMSKRAIPCDQESCKNIALNEA